MGGACSMCSAGAEVHTKLRHMNSKEWQKLTEVVLPSSGFGSSDTAKKAAVVLEKKPEWFNGSELRAHSWNMLAKVVFTSWYRPDDLNEDKTTEVGVYNDRIYKVCKCQVYGAGWILVDACDSHVVYHNPADGSTIVALARNGALVAITSTDDWHHILTKAVPIIAGICQRLTAQIAEGLMVAEKVVVAGYSIGGLAALLIGQRLALKAVALNACGFGQLAYVKSLTLVSLKMQLNRRLRDGREVVKFDVLSAKLKPSCYQNVIKAIAFRDPVANSAFRRVHWANASVVFSSVWLQVAFKPVDLRHVSRWHIWAVCRNWLRYELVTDDSYYHKVVARMAAVMDTQCAVAGAAKTTEAGATRTVAKKTDSEVEMTSKSKTAVAGESAKFGGTKKSAIIFDRQIHKPDLWRVPVQKRFGQFKKEILSLVYMYAFIPPKLAYSGSLQLWSLAAFARGLNETLVDKVWAALTAKKTVDNDCIDAEHIHKALNFFARLYYEAYCREQKTAKKQRLKTKQINAMMRPVGDHFVKYKMPDKPRIFKSELCFTIGRWLDEASDFATL